MKYKLFSVLFCFLILFTSACSCDGNKIPPPTINNNYNGYLEVELKNDNKEFDNTPFVPLFSFYDNEGNIVENVEYSVFYYKNGQLLDAPPKDVGEYKLFCEINGKNIGSLRTDFIIGKQKIEIECVDQVYLGSEPQFDVSNEGLLYDKNLNREITYGGLDSVPEDYYGGITVDIKLYNDYCYGETTATLFVEQPDRELAFNEGNVFAYDGNRKTFSVNGGGEDVEIEYFKAVNSDFEPLIDAPIDAGRYKVIASNNLKTCEREFVIGKKDVSKEISLLERVIDFDFDKESNLPSFVLPDGISENDITVSYQLVDKENSVVYYNNLPYMPGDYKATVRVKDDCANYCGEISGNFYIVCKNMLDAYKFADKYYTEIAPSFASEVVGGTTVKNSLGTNSLKVSTKKQMNNGLFYVCNQTYGTVKVTLVTIDPSFGMETYFDKTSQDLFTRRVEKNTSISGEDIITNFGDKEFSCKTKNWFKEKYGVLPNGLSGYIINENTVKNKLDKVVQTKDGFFEFTLDLTSKSYDNYKIQVVAMSGQDNAKFERFVYSNVKFKLDKWGRCLEIKIDESYVLNAVIENTTVLKSTETFDYGFSENVLFPN